MELKGKASTPELWMFQEFVTKIMKQDQQAKFIPWFNKNASNLPEIDASNLPYKVIKGKVRLKDYLGTYNWSKDRIYGQVKVQSWYAFKELKDKVVDWLRDGLHWIKEYYSQARRVTLACLQGRTMLSASYVQDRHLSKR